MIFENQPLKLKATVKDNGVPVDLTGAESVKFNYWKPGSSSLSGAYDATILDAVSGDIEYDIPRDILSLGNWRFRGRAEFSNGVYLADEVIVVAVNKADS